MKVFGANVRGERVKKGWPQEEFAEKAEISTRNLKMVEAGHLNILLTKSSRLHLKPALFVEGLMPDD